MLTVVGAKQCDAVESLIICYSVQLPLQSTAAAYCISASSSYSTVYIHPIVLYCICYDINVVDMNVYDNNA